MRFINPTSRDPHCSPLVVRAVNLRTNSDSIEVQQSRVHRPAAISVLRVEKHMPAIVVDIRTSRRCQAIAIACCE